jgi:hypothetical protein
MWVAVEVVGIPSGDACAGQNLFPGFPNHREPRSTSRTVSSTIGCERMGTVKSPLFPGAALPWSYPSFEVFGS